MTVFLGALVFAVGGTAFVTVIVLGIVGAIWVCEKVERKWNIPGEVVGFPLTIFFILLLIGWASALTGGK